MEIKNKLWYIEQRGCLAKISQLVSDVGPTDHNGVVRAQPGALFKNGEEDRGKLGHSAKIEFAPLWLPASCIGVGPGHQCCRMVTPLFPRTSRSY